MEYYPAMKRSQIFSFATTQVALEDIMLSEVSQRKTITMWFHLWVESKKQN